MSQPLLSIGMIVKNEERCLEKCLKALEPLRQAIPCELVIADTGSTDKTREIAEKYADILFDFTWVNDFAKARNAVMDKCSGEWFLTLDADEYLASDTNELVSFLKSNKAKKMVLATIVIRNHFSKNLDSTYSDFNAIRMCRMNTKARYSGAIHEHFDYPTTYDKVYILTETLFNHDGYAFISTEHKKQKELRNMELLKKKLEENPDDLKTILQCLESSAHNSQNRHYYTQYAIEKLKTVDRSTSDWESAAANCAKQIALYLNYDFDPKQEEWFDWVFKTFPTSEHTLIDTKFVYVKYLYTKEDYINCIKIGKEYLNALESRKKQNNTASLEKVTLSLLHATNIHKNEVQILIASSMLKENREDEAIKTLTQIDFQEKSNALKNWFSVLHDIPINDKNTDKISTFIKKLLEKTSDSASNFQECVLSIVTGFFTVSTKNEVYKLFKNIPGTIGLSVKIIESKTKESAEEYLNKIENWEEFMPLALNQALLLKCDLPKDFYSISASRLSFLISDLSKEKTGFLDTFLENSCNQTEALEPLQISFIFNLLFSLSLNRFDDMNDELKANFTTKLTRIADTYLTTYYNSDLLKNESYINCLPPIHSFAWYLVKAAGLKETNSLEYIKTLRTALNIAPQTKEVIEYLIKKLNAEQEQKKQNQIKNATPELVAMATQLKTMLSALPENSPELLAIKQSPMYKQVAFLIED